jgi:hypothetical protein
MSLLEGILETVFGKVHFMVFVGESPALEVNMHDKEITVEIKNPVLAMEMGLEGLAKKNSMGSTMKKLKAMGYTIKIKYKIFELDL